MKVRGGAARRKGEAELPHQESHHPCRASAREHNTAPAIFKSALRRLAPRITITTAHAPLPQTLEKKVADARI